MRGSARAAVPEFCRPGAADNGLPFSHGLGTAQSKVTVPASSRPGGRPLPGLRTATSSWWPCTPSSSRPPSPRPSPHQRPSRSPRTALPSDSVAVGAGASTREFWGHDSVPSRSKGQASQAQLIRESFYLQGPRCAFSPTLCLNVALPRASPFLRRSPRGLCLLSPHRPPIPSRGPPPTALTVQFPPSFFLAFSSI